MIKHVRVSAPARLHFGLFSIGTLSEFQFGGAGLMLNGPRTTITAKHAEQLIVDINLPNRESGEIESIQNSVQKVLSNWLAKSKSDQDPMIGDIDELPFHLTIEELPPRHAGFGSGTQLALSIIVAVLELQGLKLPDAASIAELTNRGKRSAIGTHGFFTGGFLVDRGKASSGSKLAQLDSRTEFPSDWPIITVLNREIEGLSGPSEVEAFTELPPTPPQQRLEMIEIAQQSIIPAIASRNYDDFASSVFEFGQRSGMMYAPLQNGPFNGVQIEQTVQLVRQFGIEAVGQSSWGPCVFAVAPSLQAANDLVASLDDSMPKHSLAHAEIQIHHADNAGVIIERNSP